MHFNCAFTQYIAMHKQLEYSDKKPVSSVFRTFIICGVQDQQFRVDIRVKNLSFTTIQIKGGGGHISKCIAPRASTVGSYVTGGLQHTLLPIHPLLAHFDVFEIWNCRLDEIHISRCDATGNAYEKLVLIITPMLIQCNSLRY